eukprot:m.34652 g.34652  ORF g.34652 m.34652 type:complete len:54 (+) comp17011_c0_seq1:272-433(+)
MTTPSNTNSQQKTTASDEGERDDGVTITLFRFSTHYYTNAYQHCPKERADMFI